MRFQYTNPKESQFDTAVVDLIDEELFPSQSYVQLSRVTSLDSLYIKGTISDSRFTQSRFFSGFNELVAEYKRLNIYQDMLCHTQTEEQTDT